MTTPLPNDTRLEHLGWYRLRICIQNTRAHTFSQESLLVIWQALQKAVAARVCTLGMAPAVVVVRPQPSATLFKPPQLGDRYSADFLLFDCDQHTANAWLKVIQTQFAEAVRNFQLCAAPELEAIRFVAQALPAVADVALRFYTPLPYKKTSTHRHISTTQFAQALQARITRLFDMTPTLPLADVQVLPWALKRQRIIHHSKSQAGTQQWLAGYTGTLVLKGDWQAWWSWLCLAETIGMGGQLGFAMGHCELIAPAPHTGDVLACP